MWPLQSLAEASTKGIFMGLLALYCCLYKLCGDVMQSMLVKLASLTQGCCSRSGAAFLQP